MLNPNLPHPTVLLEQFSNARPFKHLCIDNFLIASVAEQLLANFPQFDDRHALNEFGDVGAKATREDVRALGPGYAALDDYISSPHFLRYISSITGVPDLLYDPSYFGGGTHDNKNGQALDPHVDFNFDRSTSLHRRLNVIIYLNKEWEKTWGGSIEIHSNPRVPHENRIVSFEPLFNRCVLFETNEVSWHGFPQIILPPEFGHLSRKSFAIYLYSKTRPTSEMAPPHRTFYIPRPLSDHIQIGTTLTEKDMLAIRSSIQQRDTHLYSYQSLELELSSQIQSLRHYATELAESVRCRCMGYVIQEHAPQGFSPDNWISDAFKAAFIPQRPVYGFDLTVSIPVRLPYQASITVSLNGDKIKEYALPQGKPVVVPIVITTPLSEEFTLTISGKCFTPASLGLNNDDRALLCRLEMISFKH